MTTEELTRSLGAHDTEGVDRLLRKMTALDDRIGQLELELEGTDVLTRQSELARTAARDRLPDTGVERAVRAVLRLVRWGSWAGDAVVLGPVGIAAVGGTCSLPGFMLVGLLGLIGGLAYVAEEVWYPAGA